MRIVLVFSLMTAAAPTFAQWVKVDQKDNVVHYVDLATISKTGQIRRVWITQYLGEKESDDETSRRAFLEYDCVGRRFRYLSIANHFASKAGGQSPSAQENTPQKMRYVPAPMNAEVVQRIVCAP